MLWKGFAPAHQKQGECSLFPAPLSPLPPAASRPDRKGQAASRCCAPLTIRPPVSFSGVRKRLRKQGSGNAPPLLIFDNRQHLQGQLDRCGL